MANLFSQPFVLLSTMNVRMSQWKISSLPQVPPAGGGRQGAGHVRAVVAPAGMEGAWAAALGQAPK